MVGLTGDDNARCAVGKCAMNGVPVGPPPAPIKFEPDVIEKGDDDVVEENPVTGMEVEDVEVYDPVADFEKEVASVSEQNVLRVSGESMVPAPGVKVNVPVQAKIAAILELMMTVKPKDVELKELPSFEQTLIGNFIWKLHTMIAKQKGYGPHNISKAGLKGVVTRTQDKLERAKTLVGDSDTQVARVKKILDNKLPNMANDSDAIDILADIDAVVNPKSALDDESLLDTLGDLGNYGDIGVLLHEGAWGKEAETF